MRGFLLLKRFQYLTYIILSLTWGQESIAFEDMMMTMNYLQVKIYQNILPSRTYIIKENK
jgi:hypothetical protein